MNKLKTILLTFLLLTNFGCIEGDKETAVEVKARISERFPLPSLSRAIRQWARIARPTKLDEVRTLERLHQEWVARYDHIDCLPIRENATVKSLFNIQTYLASLAVKHRADSAFLEQEYLRSVFQYGPEFTKTFPTTEN